MSATPTDSEATSSMIPAPALKKSSKASKLKPTKTIVLYLSPASLSKFPSDVSSGKTSRSKPPITVTASEDTNPDAGDDDGSSHGKAKGDDTAGTADASSTPQPSEVNGDASLAPPAVNGLKRKGGPGSKSDPAKRSSTAVDADGNPKPRGKPGPKRRKGLDGEGGTKGMWTAPAPLNHKLGPKANQGDINARLRALDRSGKPCRKWQRQGLQLKSFNGVNWGMASWKTNKTASSGFEGDVKSDTTGSSDAKQEPASSNVASEKSHGGADSNAPPASTTDLASSPAPLAAVEALAAA